MFTKTINRPYIENLFKADTDLGTKRQIFLDATKNTTRKWFLKMEMTQISMNVRMTANNINTSPIQKYLFRPQNF